MTASLPSVIVPPSVAGQPHARRRNSGGSEFATHLPAAKLPACAAAQQGVASGIDSIALLAVSAYSDESPRRRRPSQVVVEDALSALKRLQVLLLGHSCGDVDVRELEALASELEDTAGVSAACQGILLRLRVEIAKRVAGRTN
jgi:hypothetical protein